MPGVEFSVQDQSAAHTGSHKETDNVPVAPPGTVLILTQHTQIHIVADKKRNAEVLFHRTFHVIIAHREIRCKEHRSGLLIDHAGGAGGQSPDLFPVDPGFLNHFLHHADDDLLDVAALIVACFRAFFQAVDDLFVFIEDGAEDLCPANVQADVIFLFHICSLCVSVRILPLIRIVF